MRTEACVSYSTGWEDRMERAALTSSENRLSCLYFSDKKNQYHLEQNKSLLVINAIRHLAATDDASLHHNGSIQHTQKKKRGLLSPDSTQVLKNPEGSGSPELIWWKVFERERKGDTQENTEAL